MTDYGTEKTTSTINGDQIADVVKYRDGLVVKRMCNYRIRVKVTTSQDEMTEFIRFTDELTKYRQKGRLVVDKEDPSTFPAFIIHYPKDNWNGGYFIVKSYTVIV